MKSQHHFHLPPTQADIHDIGMRSYRRGLLFIAVDGDGHFKFP